MRDATPTAKDSFDQPMFANRPSAPQVAGFNRPRKQGIKPWILIIGALIISVLNNGLRIMSIPQEWQNVILGLVILAAVYADMARKRSA